MIANCQASVPESSLRMQVAWFSRVFTLPRPLP